MPLAPLNDALKRGGWEEVGREVQRLWVAGKRPEAIAKVPAERVIQANLLGGTEMVRKRIRAYKDAGVTTLRVGPQGARPRGQTHDARARMDLVRDCGSIAGPLAGDPRATRLLRSSWREGPRVRTIVFAEGSWSMEEPNERRLQGKTFGTAMGVVRWDKVGEGLGCASFYVEKLPDLEPALHRAREANEPAVICLRTDRDANLAIPGELGLRFAEVYQGPMGQ